MSQALVEAGNRTREAAQAKNTERLFDVGEQIDSACETAMTLTLRCPEKRKVFEILMDGYAFLIWRIRL
jgi:hypothetical protein